MGHRIVFSHRWALGDTVVMSAFIRDLSLTFPGKYEISVDTHWTPVWKNNPYIVPFDKKTKAQRLTLTYRDGIIAAGRGEKVHFLAWYHRDFERKTGIKVPVHRPYGDIHLTDAEKKPLVTGRYWLILSGGKLDLTTKIWETSRFQQVVDILAGFGIHCVQAGGTHSRHVHPPLRNVLSMVGKTDNVRDLFSLIYNAEGVICGVTGAMHVAACFEKPCVVINAGREEPWWEAYNSDYGQFGPTCPPIRVPHRFLHTIGLLDCCLNKGCWKKRVVPLDQNDLYRQRDTLCKRPIREPGRQALPACMDMITAERVVEAVISYYVEGYLPQPEEWTVTPAIDKPLAARLPDGRQALLQLQLVDGSAAAAEPVPVVEKPAAIKPILLPGFAHKLLDLTRPPQLEKPQVPQQQALPPEIDRHQGSPAMRTHDADVLDHPLIGGKITVFVLCYGNHPDLARRCLKSIFNSVPAKRLDLRVGANECSAETLAYLESLPLTKLYRWEQNIFKYPAMRQMFHDPACPIATKYLVWFDDDSYVTKYNWLQVLGENIVKNHEHGCRLFGWKFIHDLNGYRKHGNVPEAWFKSATWYRNKQFRIKGRDLEAPNGTVLHFVTGGFWALETELMRVADIPDVRLANNGGDCCIGEQVHQAGGRIKDFNRNKQYVFSSGSARRGVTHKFPWSH